MCGILYLALSSRPHGTHFPARSTVLLFLLFLASWFLGIIHSNIWSFYDDPICVTRRAPTSLLPQSPPQLRRRRKSREISSSAKKASSSCLCLNLIEKSILPEVAPNHHSRNLMRMRKCRFPHVLQRRYLACRKELRSSSMQAMVRKKSRKARIWWQWRNGDGVICWRSTCWPIQWYAASPWPRSLWFWCSRWRGVQRNGPSPFSPLETAPHSF